MGDVPMSFQGWERTVFSFRPHFQDPCSRSHSSS